MSAGTTYYYRIRAYNGSGTSGNSNTITVTTSGGAPSVPVATAATNITSSSFQENWGASSGATGYYMDVSTNSSFSTYVFNNYDVGNYIGINVTPLSAGTTYYYRVRAYNGFGTSGNSNTISVTTLGGAPAAPVATAATSITSSTFLANWNTSSGATGYYIDVSTNSSFSSYVVNNFAVGNATSITVNSSLSAGTTNYYRIRAYNGFGTSGNSNTITVTTNGNAPSAPVATTATGVTSTSFQANWNASSGATGYYIDMSNSSTFSTYLTNNYDMGSSTGASFSSLSASTTYYYRVRAYNGSGTSGNSNTITVTTNGTAPSAPVATTATGVTSTSFQANWGASSGATGYYMDVSTNSTFSIYVFNSYDVGNYTGINVTPLSAGTTYYYRIRAYNGFGTSGNSGTITVTTNGSAATVTTPTSASVTGTTATLGGNVTSNGGATVTALGMVFSPTATNANPQIGGMGVTNVTGTGSSGVFTVSASALTPGTAYTFAAYATNSQGTAYSVTGSFTTLSNNGNLSNIALSSGTLAPAFASGTLAYTATVNYTTTSITVTPSTSQANAAIRVNGTTVTSGSASGSISLSLGSNTINLLVTAQDGITAQSYAVTVTRLGPPTVTTPTYASITTTTATLGGNVAGNGGATVTALGVVFSPTATNANPQIGGTGVTNVTGTGTSGVFTVSASALTPGTAYTFAAYATNSQGTGYSVTGSFTTTAIVTVPTVTTPTYASIATTTATLGGNVSTSGGATIIMRGVVLSPTVTNNNPQIGGTGVINVTGTGTTGIFTVSASSLTPGTAYTFKAYATNSAGPGYSVLGNFTTAATVPSVTSPTSASITTTTATLGGNVTATGGAAITSRGVVFSITSANGNPQLGGAGVTNVTGTGTTGVFTVTASGLAPNSAYTFIAYATNSIGTSYSMIGSFTTNPTANWLVANGFAASADLASDPNGDGVSLLMAYALNLDPKLNLSHSLPMPVLAANQLSLTYYAGRQGVSYSVETSTDLKTWSTSGVTVTAPDANNLRTASIPRTGSRHFLRLGVAVP